MAVYFRARLASIRITPSRSEDASDVSRFVLEAHDLAVDPMRELLDQDVVVTLQPAPVPLTPLEVAIEHSANGSSEEAVVPSPGRRRRGTRADSTEGE